MMELSPRETLQQVSEALPEDCRENLVVVGSLAAGFHFFGEDPNRAVRTKDVDCVLEPFHVAVDAGQRIATRLLELGWRQKAGQKDRPPGDENTPKEDLPVIRLVPPEMAPENPDWFVELLCVPKDPGEVGRRYTRIALEQGHYGLPSFQYMAVTAWKPFKSDRFRLRYAQPAMMALANLLSHSNIGPETMSEPIDGRIIKRANKDLGRVLALAKLADLNDYAPWGESWVTTMNDLYGNSWNLPSRTLGSGLRELMASPDDLEEAVYTCRVGLLSSLQVSPESILIVGERLLGEAIEFVEENAQDGGA